MARKPGPPTKELVDKVWEKGAPIRGENPDVRRRDPYGNPIYKPSFGKQGDQSWEIDHIKPTSKGGSDHLKNLQPLQTETNREKADKYPFKPEPSKPRRK